MVETAVVRLPSVVAPRRLKCVCLSSFGALLLEHVRANVCGKCLLERSSVALETGSPGPRRHQRTDLAPRGAEEDRAA